ncbi:Ku protein [Rhizobium sp. Root149]|uniref:Non-homologous end joining protein Ku n=1 Tax=Rhizobium rhizoryzae TaxID=451876 RepID=A0A7W6LGP7_9HYPH|nr:MULTISPECIES: Ku protein [Rhizobium]KQZ50161.1 Ku protein [Rhizobium sp. Root149]MBB4144076.1 DNA end-binding protein Ku [Rhizobium rhizoryzae]
MAPHVFWKGYLKLSLVTCRVTMAPAVSESGKVRFHNLNAKTHNRVLSQYVDGVTGKPVDDDDQVKGFERSEDDYVLFEDEELDDVGLESTRTIDIEAFVPSGEIGWIWYDRPHFLAPDDKVGEEAFSVIREAMAATGMVGIARLVMYRRERAVMLVPDGKGIIVWTLRYGDEVRDADAYYQLAQPGKSDAQHLSLIKKLIGERIEKWDPAMADDPVQDKLLDIIKRRKKSKKTRATPSKSGAKRSDNVVDIMSALKKSLDDERRAKGK